MTPLIRESIKNKGNKCRVIFKIVPVIVSAQRVKIAHHYKLAVGLQQWSQNL